MIDEMSCLEHKLGFDLGIKDPVRLSCIYFRPCCMHLCNTLWLHLHPQVLYHVPFDI